MRFGIRESRDLACLAGKATYPCLGGFGNKVARAFGRLRPCALKPLGDIRSRADSVRPEFDSGPRAVDSWGTDAAPR